MVSQTTQQRPTAGDLFHTWAHARVIRSEHEAHASIVAQLTAQAAFRAHVARVLAPRAKA